MTKPTIEEQIKKAMTSEGEAEHADGADLQDVTDAVVTPEAETNVEGESAGVVKKTDLAPDASGPDDAHLSAPVETVQKVDAPVALSGAIKAKWDALPDDVKVEWKKREDDIHKMMTAHDGDLRMGRSIKEIATPYEAVIRAEGGTVEGAFKDLLNTAYVLRTGSPHQKAQVIMQAAQQYGVDLGLYQQAQQNPQFAQLQNEIHQLRQQASPQVIEKQLQERLEQDRITNEISAFAANPKNVHFDAVRATMGSLMTSGRAANLQEAYEAACWADPSIRSSIMATQAAEQAAAKKKEMEAKRKASASVTGSPDGSSPSTKAPKQSLEDQIRNQLREATGSIA